MQAQAQTCGTLVELLQACQSAGRVPRVVLVTAGAQPVNATGEVTAVAQAPLWGLGRVLSLEQPSTAPLLDRLQRSRRRPTNWTASSPRR